MFRLLVTTLVATAGASKCHYAAPVPNMANPYPPASTPVSPDAPVPDMPNPYPPVSPDGVPPAPCDDDNQPAVSPGDPQYGAPNANGYTDGIVSPNGPTDGSAAPEPVYTNPVETNNNKGAYNKNESKSSSDAASSTTTDKATEAPSSDDSSSSSNSSSSDSSSSSNTISNATETTTETVNKVRTLEAGIYTIANAKMGRHHLEQLGVNWRRKVKLNVRSAQWEVVYDTTHPEEFYLVNKQVKRNRNFFNYRLRGPGGLAWTAFVHASKGDRFKAIPVPNTDTQFYIQATTGKREGKYLSIRRQKRVRFRNEKHRTPWFFQLAKLS